MYKVKRGILWFYVGQDVMKTELDKWFKQAAIKELVESGYIEKYKRGKTCSAPNPLHLAV